MRQTLLYWLSFSLVLGSEILSAQDISRLGGALTSELPGRHAIQVAAPNVTARDRFELQTSGFSIFHKRVSQKEGLGPYFNNRSCGGCHVDNGRGPLRLSSEERGGSTFIVKLQPRPGVSSQLKKELKRVGEQLRDQQVSGKPRYRIRLSWKSVSGRYGNGKRYKLRAPLLRFKIPGIRRKLLSASMRMTPAIIGPGLLEAVPDAAILAMSDPTDVDGDGISGQASLVVDRRTGKLRIGRFGFRASHPTVEQQSAAAAFNDMGLSNVLFPGRRNEQELSEESLSRVTAYLQLAGVPFARDQEDPTVQAGLVLFQKIGCETCHRMTLRTSAGVAPELENQEIHPFTDLLLHDMGPGLADTRIGRKSLGREWRTTPLWGLGYASSISKVKPLYLHDGRARSIEEAILWHGGEAATSQRLFRYLYPEERSTLLRFLKSL